MGGKTLTRADLAEAVVQKVGLPRNESQELVELILRGDFDEPGGRQGGQAVVVRLVRHPPEGPARRPQSQDGAGSADHAAARAGVPAEQHHEGSHQRGPDPAQSGRVARRRHAAQRGLALTKAVEAFRNIGEVSEELGVKKHVLRFWEAKFPQLKPMKRGGGRRLYRPSDVELLRGLHDLLQTRATPSAACRRSCARTASRPSRRSSAPRCAPRRRHRPAPTRAGRRP